MSWDDTDLPVLRAIAAAELEPGEVGLETVVERTALDRRPVQLALLRLLHDDLIVGQPLQSLGEDLPGDFMGLRTTLSGQRRLE